MTLKTKYIRQPDEIALNYSYDNSSVKNSIKDICDFFEADLGLKIHTDVTAQLDQNNIPNIDINNEINVIKGSYTKALVPYGYKVYELENTNSVSKTYIKFTFGLQHLSYNTVMKNALSFMITIEVCNSIMADGTINPNNVLYGTTLGNSKFHTNDSTGHNYNNFKVTYNYKDSIGSYDKNTGKLFFCILPESGFEYNTSARNTAAARFCFYLEKVYSIIGSATNDYINAINLCRGSYNTNTSININIYNIDISSRTAFNHTMLVFLPVKSYESYASKITVVKTKSINPVTNQLLNNNNVLVYQASTIPKLKQVTIDTDIFIAVNQNLTGVITTDSKYGLLIKV